MQNIKYLKNFCKFIICLLFFIAASLVFSNNVDATTYPRIGDFKCSLTNNELTLIEYIGKDTEIEIPSKLNNYPVVSIGSHTFSSCTNITSVKIPNTIINIGPRAFSRCTSLIYINIPNSVATIDMNAFSGCTSLTSIEIPNSVTSIENEAFANCSNLENINMPNTMKSIGEGAFSNCSKLTSVEIPDGVTSIERYAFDNCTSLTSITIADSVTSIKYRAFSNCTNLTSINIPNGVTSIERYAFADCNNLISINIPNSVTSIENPFWNCDALVNIEVDNENYIYKDGCLYTKDTIIFCNSKNNEIVLPVSIKYIKPYAFATCKFTSITLPNSLETIGYGAFRYCTKLENIIIPNNVKIIDGGAFYYCSNLTNITISNSVSNINNTAFEECHNLNITVDSSNPYYSSEDGALYNKDKTELLCYPSAKGEIVIKNSVKTISSYAFYKCKNITSVIIPANVENIKKEAFADCTNLDKVTIYNKTINIYNEVYTSSFSYSFPTFYGYAGSTVEDYAKKFNRKFVDITTYYTVTFKDFDGKVLKTEKVAQGKSATSPANPTRTGYDFIGWDKSFNSITQDLIVTAKYKIITYYTVTFKDFNGKVLKTEQVVQGKNATSPANPTRTGYTFTGWDKSFTSVNQNLVITAKYKINTFTVEFKDYNKNTIKKQTVNYGSNATAPVPPIKARYEFLKWDKSFNNVTKDLVVNAQYEYIPYYRVEFVDSDGKELKSQNLEKGKNALAPLINKQGYKFISWDKKFTNVTSDIVVTAKYQVYRLPFKDVPSNAYYMPALDYMNKNNFISGTSTTTFSPNSNLTRGMLVTILWNMEGRPTVQTQNKFPDVVNNAYYTSAIKWAVANKIVNGYSNGTFAPNKNITREEVATFLVNYSIYKGTYKSATTNLNKFKDNFKVSSWAKPTVQWAIANKIISGKSNGTIIAPNNTATRAEAITMIKNYLDKVVVVNFLNAENTYLKAQVNRLKLEEDLINLERDLSNKQYNFNKAKTNLQEAKENLTKVENQKDTYMFVNGKWAFVADPDRVAAAKNFLNEQQTKFNTANSNLTSIKSNLDLKNKQFVQAQNTEKSKYNAYTPWKTRVEKLKL